MEGEALLAEVRRSAFVHRAHHAADDVLAGPRLEVVVERALEDDAVSEDGDRRLVAAARRPERLIGSRGRLLIGHAFSLAAFRVANSDRFWSSPTQTRRSDRGSSTPTAGRLCWRAWLSHSTRSFGAHAWTY